VEEIMAIATVGNCQEIIKQLGERTASSKDAMLTIPSCNKAGYHQLDNTTPRLGNL